MAVRESGSLSYKGLQAFQTEHRTCRLNGIEPYWRLEIKSGEWHTNLNYQLRAHGSYENAGQWK